MKKYIELNTNLRKQAKNDFQKDFFKLMNNSVFGKTMEDVKNRRNYKVCDSYKKWNKYVCDVNFKSSIKISENLILMEMYNKKYKLNKPI